LLFVPSSFDFAADSGCRLPPALTPAKRLKLRLIGAWSGPVVFRHPSTPLRAGS